MLTLFFIYSVALQRQPAFDTFDSSNSLFAGYFFSLNEDQTLQEVPTGFDSTSYGNCSLCSLVQSADQKEIRGTIMSWHYSHKCYMILPKKKCFSTQTSVFCPCESLCGSLLFSVLKRNGDWASVA